MIIINHSGTVLVPKIIKTIKNDANMDNQIKRNIEKTPFVITINYGVNREGGRTVGSGRVATIIE